MFLKRTWSFFEGKKVGFVGLGKSNFAVMETLPAGAEIVLRSDKIISDLGSHFYAYDKAPKNGGHAPLEISDCSGEDADEHCSFENSEERWSCKRTGERRTSESSGECCADAGADKRMSLSTKVRDMIPSKVRVVGIHDGPCALKGIDEDILVLSPSVRRERSEIIEAMKRGVLITSDMEMFFDREPYPVLAVTGSAGKSTTATLAHLMLGGREGGCSLVGNVGEPACIAPPDSGIYVVELSSFMLRYGVGRVNRAAITNITPNHLDWHESYEEYIDTKHSLLSHSDEAVLSVDDPLLSEWASGKGIYGVISVRHSLKELMKRYSAEVYGSIEDGYLCLNGEKIFDTGAAYRNDPYTLSNMLIALALTHGYAKRERVASALCGFGGLLHRCEEVGTVRGVRYINSSIDTTPERCESTLTALGQQVILLLGGKGKGLSYDSLIPAVKRYAKRVIAFGEEGDKIFRSLYTQVTVDRFTSFREGVLAAMELALPSDTVLLSPACTSYDEFEGFDARGEEFRRLVLSAGQEIDL